MENTITCPIKPKRTNDGLPLAGLRLFQYGFVNVTGLSIKKLTEEKPGLDSYHVFVLQARQEWCDQYWTIDERYFLIITSTGEVWIKILSEEPVHPPRCRIPEIQGPCWTTIHSVARIGGDFPEELRENFFSGGHNGDEFSIRGEAFDRRQQNPLDDRHGSPYPQKIK